MRITQYISAHTHASAARPVSHIERETHVHRVPVSRMSRFFADAGFSNTSNAAGGLFRGDTRAPRPADWLPGPLHVERRWRTDARFVVPGSHRVGLRWAASSADFRCGPENTRVHGGLGSFSRGATRATDALSARPFLPESTPPSLLVFLTSVKSRPLCASRASSTTRASTRLEHQRSRPAVVQVYDQKWVTTSSASPARR